MGLFDFLKSKNKSEEISSVPKPKITSSHPTKQEQIIEVSTPQLYSKSTVEEKITDADGNVYTIVKIGTQYWTLENMKTTKYNDGSPIPCETDGLSWSTLKTPAYCWYNNDIRNKEK